MADITIDVNWEILPARETWANIGEKRFDVDKQGDMSLGPEPASPPSPAEETDGHQMTINPGNY